MNKKTEEVAVNVTLLLPHTHAGIDRSIGETITVSQSQADWLKQLGIVEDKQDKPDES